MNSDLSFIIEITNHYNKMQGGGAQILHRTIQNRPATPWLDWIEAGIKKYEGRLNRGGWANVKVGDIIYWTDGKKTVKTIITELKYYLDFGSAFRDLGSQLIPIKGIDERGVNKLYSQYFSDTDIKKYGTIAIGLDVLNQ